MKQKVEIPACYLWRNNNLTFNLIVIITKKQQMNNISGIKFAVKRQQEHKLGFVRVMTPLHNNWPDTADIWRTGRTGGFMGNLIQNLHCQPWACFCCSHLVQSNEIKILFAFKFEKVRYFAMLHAIQKQLQQTKKHLYITWLGCSTHYYSVLCILVLKIDWANCPKNNKLHIISHGKCSFFLTRKRLDVKCERDTSQQKAVSDSVSTDELSEESQDAGSGWI